MVALIEGGSFYQLENAGTAPMVLMGTRTGPREANPHVDFDAKTQIPHPKFTQGPKVEYADDRGDSMRKMGPVSGQ